MRTRLLVVESSDVDPVERLGEWLVQAGTELTVCRPASDGVPEGFDGLDGVVCMGGEMGAYDETEHPWLAALRWWLADAVARDLPVLGVCLGGQLLAAATGGGVRRAVDGPEVGTLLIAKRDAAAHDPLFAQLPPATVLDWARRDSAGVFPPGQLDPDHLERVHADIAEAWQPFATRFVALARGELAPAAGSQDRRTLPVLRS